MRDASRDAKRDTQNTMVREEDTRLLPGQLILLRAGSAPGRRHCCSPRRRLPPPEEEPPPVAPALQDRAGDNFKEGVVRAAPAP